MTSSVPSALTPPLALPALPPLPVDLSALRAAALESKKRKAEALARQESSTAASGSACTVARATRDLSGDSLEEGEIVRSQKRRATRESEETEDQPLAEAVAGRASGNQSLTSARNKIKHKQRERAVQKERARVTAAAADDADDDDIIVISTTRASVARPPPPVSKAQALLSLPSPLSSGDAMEEEFPSEYF